MRSFLASITALIISSEPIAFADQVDLAMGLELPDRAQGSTRGQAEDHERDLKCQMSGA